MIANILILSTLNKKNSNTQIILSQSQLYNINSLNLFVDRKFSIFKLNRFVF